MPGMCRLVLFNQFLLRLHDDIWQVDLVRGSIVDIIPE